MLAEFNANNARALDTLINEHGVTLRKFNDNILRELGRVSAEVVAEAANHDDLARQIYDSFLRLGSVVCAGAILRKKHLWMPATFQRLRHKWLKTS